MEFSKGQKVAIAVLVASVALIAFYEYWLWHYVPRADYYLCYKEIPTYGQPPIDWSCTEKNESRVTDCVAVTEDKAYLRCQYRGTGNLP